jgi:hypothetical protein
MSAQAIWSWVTGLHSLCHLPSLKTMIIARSAVPRRLLWEGWENLWFFHAFHSSSSSSCGKRGKVYGPFPRFPQVKATGPIPAAYVLQKLRHFHLCLTPRLSPLGRAVVQNHPAAKARQESIIDRVITVLKDLFILLKCQFGISSSNAPGHYWSSAYRYYTVYELKMGQKSDCACSL